jgi:hypothetical protein
MDAEQRARIQALLDDHVQRRQEQAAADAVLAAAKANAPDELAERRAQHQQAGGA